jgi:hypothetical protein
MYLTGLCHWNFYSIPTLVAWLTRGSFLASKRRRYDRGPDRTQRGDYAPQQLGLTMEVDGNKVLTMNSANALANRFRAALDPRNAPKPVRTMADMTPAERAEMLKLYKR